MKAFVAACITFSLLTLFLFGSAAFLSREALSLTEEAEALATAPSEEREAAAKALSERWDRERLLFVIFVREEEVDQLENALTQTCATAKIKSDSDFKIAVAEVLDQLEHLEWLVGIHLENVF